MSKPVLYLFCGLPGTGKTTYAKSLESENCRRYSLDEFFLAKYKGQELTPEQFNTAEQDIKDNLKSQISENLRLGKSVILDYGLWKKVERDSYKQFAEENGAEWKLMYFKVPKEVQLSRLTDRETERNHKITPELLSIFVGRFEEPKDEGEEIII